MIVRSILDLHNNGYEQQAFSIKPFIKRAHDLGEEHELITETIKFCATSEVDLISRQDLLDIYKLDIAFYIKILLTFWWGGLSHNNQAPLFYKKKNLDKIMRFSEDLETELNTSLKSDADLKAHLKSIFNKLIIKDAKFEMAGISISFFTKLFQFFYESKKEEFDLETLPIIADKWSMRALLAHSISIGHPVDFIRPPYLNNTNSDFLLSFKGSPKTNFERYWKFIEYFSDLSKTLNQKSKNLTPFKLEEILFGWQRDIGNPKNPRHIFSKIIIDYYALELELSKINES